MKPVNQKASEFPRYLKEAMDMRRSGFFSDDFPCHFPTFIFSRPCSNQVFSICCRSVRPVNQPVFFCDMSSQNEKGLDMLCGGSSSKHVSIQRCIAVTVQHRKFLNFQMLKLFNHCFNDDISMHFGLSAYSNKQQQAKTISKSHLL